MNALEELTAFADERIRNAESILKGADNVVVRTQAFGYITAMLDLSKKLEEMEARE